MHQGFWKSVEPCTRNRQPWWDSLKVWAKFVEERFWELELCFVFGELLQRTKCCRKGLHWCRLKVTGGGGGQISGFIRAWNGDCISTAIWCIVVASQTYSPFLHHTQALHGRPRPWWCWWHLSLIPHNNPYLVNSWMPRFGGWCCSSLSLVLCFWGIRRNEHWWQPQPQLIFPCPTTIQGVVRSSCDDGCGLLSLILFLKTRRDKVHWWQLKSLVLLPCPTTYKVLLGVVAMLVVVYFLWICLWGIRRDKKHWWQPQPRPHSQLLYFAQLQHKV